MPRRAAKAQDLQAQSDSAMQEPDSGSLQDQRALEEASSPGNTPAIAFAEDPDTADDYPSVPDLEYDGKGHRKPTHDMDFAEDETAPQMGDQAGTPEDIHHQPGRESDSETPTRPDRQLEDIHARSTDDDAGDRDEFDAELLGRARLYGLSEDQAREQYATPAALEQALLDHDRQSLDQYRQYQQWEHFLRSRVPQPQPQYQPPPMPRQTVPSATAPGTEVPPPTPEEIQAYQLQHPELYDDVLAQDLTGLATQTAQQIHQQRQEVTQLKSLVEQQQAMLQQFYLRQQQERQFQEQLSFDERVRSLGRGWEDVLGAEDARRLPPDSPEIANRRTVYETALQLQQVHAMQGRQIPLADLLPTSLHIAFPERTNAVNSNGNGTPSRSAPARQRDDRGRFTSVAKPTRRQHSERLSPREAALRRWDSVDKTRYDDTFGVEGGYEEI